MKTLRRAFMAGEYMYQEEAKSVSGRFEKILKIFIIFAALILAAELIWLLGVSPFRPLARIDIVGLETINSSSIGREEILAMAGIGPDTSYISTYASGIERTLMSYGFLEAARVYRQFPDRLQIVLEPRRALLSALSSVNGIAVPVLLDNQGVIFSIGESAASGSSSLPILSGLIAIEDPFPGMSIIGSLKEIYTDSLRNNTSFLVMEVSKYLGENFSSRLWTDDQVYEDVIAYLSDSYYHRTRAFFIPLFMELERIQISAPGLLAAISEIKILQNAWGGYELEIFPVHQQIRVRLSELNEDNLRYTLLLVDVLSLEGGINSLDFRSGIASYIPKGGVSE